MVFPMISIYLDMELVAILKLVKSFARSWIMRPSSQSGVMLKSWIRLDKSSRFFSSNRSNFEISCLTRESLILKLRTNLKSSNSSNAQHPWKKAEGTTSLRRFFFFPLCHAEAEHACRRAQSVCPPCERGATFAACPQPN